MFTIGIHTENRHPFDKRTPLSPKQCAYLINKYGVKIKVQPSAIRCFRDERYVQNSCELTDNLSDCDLILAVKRLRNDSLIPGKKYMFFTHTKKGQQSGRGLLETVLKNDIELLDYECLEDELGKRIIGFGQSAGFVGAYNALLCYGKKYNYYKLLPAYRCKTKSKVYSELDKITELPKRLVFTGSGRVAQGVKELLSHTNYREVSPEKFLQNNFDFPVFCNLKSKDYHKAKQGFENSNFYENPEHFDADFLKYAEVADVFIVSHYWNEVAPKLFTLQDIKKPSFNIRIIVDITADFDGSIATTTIESTIQKPFYDWDLQNLRVIGGKTVQQDTLTVMCVTNLPCELAQDASKEFGEVLKTKVLPQFFKPVKSSLIENATVTRNRELTERFMYLA